MLRTEMLGMESLSPRQSPPTRTFSSHRLSLALYPARCTLHPVSSMQNSALLVHCLEVGPYLRIQNLAVDLYRRSLHPYLSHSPHHPEDHEHCIHCPAACRPAEA